MLEDGACGWGMRKCARVQRYRCMGSISVFVHLILVFLVQSAVQTPKKARVTSQHSQAQVFKLLIVSHL